MRKFLILFVALSFVFPAVSLSQESEEKAFPAEEIDLAEYDYLFADTSEYSGIVEEISAEQLIFVEDETGETISVSVDPEIFVFVNGEAAEIGDVQKGDSVILVTYKVEGEEITDWVEVTRGRVEARDLQAAG